MVSEQKNEMEEGDGRGEGRTKACDDENHDDVAKRKLNAGPGVSPYSMQCT